MSLFSSDAPGSDAPLAVRMRPRNLDEFVGQTALVGSKGPLRLAVLQDRIGSIILWGPPGSGKSTIAHVVAGSTRSEFIRLNAVTGGVADLRREIDLAIDRRSLHGRKTIVFVDEIHRWNRAQQDALLPHVESGTIDLIGATTENPYFEVNAPLLSRSRLFRLEVLSDENVRAVITGALKDKERGFGNRGIEIAEDALDLIVAMASGDARHALNALEASGWGAIANAEPEMSPIITRETVETATQQRALRYDRAGDEHYDTISAFIKSIRGSDPDATVYWLAKMLTAGEDPKFIARRMLISASEDVGNADPMGLVIANSAAQAAMVVGMPEAQLILSQAAIYLACAPKSYASTLAISRALEAVKEKGPQPVPIHLRGSGYPGAAKMGHGAGYVSPHSDAEAAEFQLYLPEGLEAVRFYEPNDRGWEAKHRPTRRRNERST